MSFASGPVFTNAGKALHARAIAGATLTFTKMQLGDGSRGSTSIANLKALVSPVASVGISGLRYSGNFAVISGMFSNAELHTGFNWNEIGLFAADPDAPEDKPEKEEEFVPKPYQGKPAARTNKTVKKSTANKPAVKKEALKPVTNNAEKKETKAEESESLAGQMNLMDYLMPDQSLVQKAS